MVVIDADACEICIVDAPEEDVTIHGQRSLLRNGQVTGSRQTLPLLLRALAHSIPGLAV